MMNVNTYFTGAYQDLTQYSRATASKRTRFVDSASHVKQEPTNEPRADQPSEPMEERNDASMVFASMQKQHDDQLNQIKESQATAIENNKAMMEMALKPMLEFAQQTSALTAAANGNNNGNGNINGCGNGRGNGR